MDSKNSSKEEDNCKEDEEWARLIQKKEQEVKQLREKEERLCQKELHYQREKEMLLTQYKQVFPDKPDWSRKHSPGVEFSRTNDMRRKEVFELGCQIPQQRTHQEKLMVQRQEKQARKMLAEVDDALKLEKKGVGMETPLLKWHLEINNSIKMDKEKHDQNEKSSSTTDRMFYDVKYQPKDSHHSQQIKNLGRQGQQSLPGKGLEELSFNTRHKGTCVHVTVRRNNSKSSCSPVSPANVDNCFQECDTYVFTTDPHATDCQNIGLQLLLQNHQPENFIKEVVWNYIDTVIT